MGAKVNPRKDAITVDGKQLSLPDAKDALWIAVNKPKDVLTTVSDDQGRTTVLSLVPKANELRLVPVGRMGAQHNRCDDSY